MYYFRFKIPRHEDGTIAKYPLGWHGTLDRCPQNVTVLLLNDKEAWGLAKTDDTFVPKRVNADGEDSGFEIISEADALKLMSQTQQAADVFVGIQEIAKRWAKQDAEIHHN